MYGPAASPVTEETPPAPADPYGVAKWAVEQELRISRQVFGLRSIIFRPHNVYGERQNIGDRYRNVVGIFMNQILRGEPLTIFGDGTQTRGFSHVSDVAPVIAGAIERPEAYDQTFNIGADRPCSVNQLGEIVSRAMGVPFRPEYLPPRFEAAHAHASHAKARALLGYRDAMRLEEGVTAMAAWAKRVGRARASGVSRPRDRTQPATFVAGSRVERTHARSLMASAAQRRSVRLTCSRCESPRTISR